MNRRERPPLERFLGLGFSGDERPGVTFSEEERLGFYGRRGPREEG